MSHLDFDREKPKSSLKASHAGGGKSAAEQPLVSVVMPVYNAGSTLDRAVKSILAQDYCRWELLLADDGSTDDSLFLLEAWARRDDRIRVVACPHRGITATLNEALSLAKGPLIARLDADDTCPAFRLRVQVEALKSDPSLGVVSGQVRFGGNAAASRGFALYVKWLNSVVSPEAISRERFVESPVAHPSVMFRRQLVRAFGGYRQGDFPEDYELWLRWLEQGVAMGKVCSPVLCWHDSPGRLTRRDPRYSQTALYQLKARFLGRWLAGNNPHHPEVIVWGAGRETRKRAEFLVRHGIRIVAYIDIDPRKIGQTIVGRPVLSPELIPPADSCFILPFVGRRGAREDIRRRLQSRGFKEGHQFICCA